TGGAGGPGRQPLTRPETTPGREHAAGLDWRRVGSVAGGSPRAVGGFAPPRGPSPGLGGPAPPPPPCFLPPRFRARDAPCWIGPGADSFARRLAARSEGRGPRSCGDDSSWVAGRVSGGGCRAGHGAAGGRRFDAQEHGPRARGSFRDVAGERPDDAAFALRL